MLPEHFVFRDLKLDKGLVLQAILVVAASDLEMETFDLGTRKENNGSRKPANRSYPRFVILPN